MNKIIFLILLLPGLAFGASSRVLPASYTEYTYDSAGGGEDYTSLATWEADTDIDVTTTGQVLTCSSGIHADTVALAGATTDADGFRVIRAASGARGTPTSGVRFVISNAASSAVFAIEEHNAKIYDVAAKRVSTASGGYAYGFNATSVSGVVFAGCTAYDCTNTTGTSQGVGFVFSNCSGGIIVNCFATGSRGAHTGTCGFRGYSSSVAQTYYFYNLTATDNNVAGISCYTSGVATTVAVINAKNCIAQGNATNFYTYGAGTETINQTTNVTANVTFEADGYHITNDADAVGAGTDLSADGTFAFDDDIDGETRVGSWDIGADEYVSGEPPAARRRIIMVQ